MKYESSENAGPVNPEASLHSSFIIPSKVAFGVDALPPALYGTICTSP